MYGIPEPMKPDSYLYSGCPDKLFLKFKKLFYNDAEIVKFRQFLWWLEMQEDKLHPAKYSKI